MFDQYASLASSNAPETPVIYRKGRCVVGTQCCKYYVWLTRGSLLIASGWKTADGLLPKQCIHPSGVAICIEEPKESQRNIMGIFASCGKDCDIRLVLSHVT
jgi:hypothetical protein